MNKEIINKTEAVLKETFANSTYLQQNPSEAAYRLEHSYRVANIAKEIALAEGFDVTQAVVAGLLHDIAYCEEMVTREDHRNHGRRGAEIARPFWNPWAFHRKMSMLFVTALLSMWTTRLPLNGNALRFLKP